MELYVRDIMEKFKMKIFCIKDKIHLMIYMWFVNISYLNFLSLIN